METFRAGYELLAERATVIRFDIRGQGLSQSDCFDATAKSQALDLEAVLDRLGIGALRPLRLQSFGRGAICLSGRPPAAP